MLRKSLGLFGRRRSLAFHPYILHMWANIALAIQKWTNNATSDANILNLALLRATTSQILMFLQTSEFNVSDTGSKWMSIDSIMLCPWSCRNEEALLAVPGGFQDVVLASAVMSCDGARRGKKENVKFPNLSERSIKVPMHWFWPQIFSTWLPLHALSKTTLSWPGSSGSLAAPQTLLCFSGMPWGWREQRPETSMVEPKSSLRWVKWLGGVVCKEGKWLWWPEVGGSGLLRCASLPSRDNRLWNQCAVKCSLAGGYYVQHYLCTSESGPGLVAAHASEGTDTWPFRANFLSPLRSLPALHILLQTVMASLTPASSHTAVSLLRTCERYTSTPPH